MHQKVLPVLRYMADNPQLLTIEYYNNCYFVATHETLHELHSINCYPETTFSVAWGWGGGRKLGALVQTSIKCPPPPLNYDAQRGGRIIEQVWYMYRRIRNVRP